MHRWLKGVTFRILSGRLTGEGLIVFIFELKFQEVELPLLKGLLFFFELTKHGAGRFQITVLEVNSVELAP